MINLPAPAQAAFEALERNHWSVDSDPVTVHGLLRGLPFDNFIVLTEAVKAAGQYQLVVPLTFAWIELNTGVSPHLFGAWFNLGVELAARGDHLNAITAYQNALVLKQDLYQATLNLGMEYERLGRLDVALDLWNNALQPNEARTSLLNQKGRLLENLKRYDEAAEALYASLLTNPRQPDVIHHWIYLRQKTCDWPIYDQRVPGASPRELAEDSGPLSLLAAFDDIVFQTHHVQRWLEKKNFPAVPHLAPAEGYAHDRIRLGYLSSDYCEHPVSYLTAELIERHDRSRFEVYGYCVTPEENCHGSTRQRITGAFDTCRVLRTLSDEQAAEIIRRDEIDILIDLNGLTLGSRLFILRHRPAPVQLTWLGYIGPIPMPELDYMICDDFVIPRELAPAYQPAPLYLPGLYQVNDTKLGIAPTPTRAEAGLPADGFVYCCFSNSYKVTEEVFDAWMAILGRTSNSVLWLLADNTWARTNMERRARLRGVDPARLIFAGRVGPREYLGRLPLADLFLDTYPYNAGTTASDALRMGLPLVTFSGQCFASRMAGSLLTHIGLTWGVTGSLAEYIDKAVEAATDPVKYREIRATIGGDAWRRSIGDIETFVPRLETAYRTIVRRPDQRQPGSIDLAALGPAA